MNEMSKVNVALKSCYEENGNAEDLIAYQEINFHLLFNIKILCRRPDSLIIELL